MSDRALICGIISGAPAIKSAKSGKRFMIATIRSGSRGAARWWRCVAFNANAIREIGKLVDGAPVAVAGEFSAEIYSPAHGKSRLNWKIAADAVVSTKSMGSAEVKWYKD